jgi:ribosome assembly protein SQT1
VYITGITETTGVVSYTTSDEVAPAEFEAFLLTHPTVANVAVVSIPDDRAGELPKAYIVKANPLSMAVSLNRKLKQDIAKYVEENKARYKRVRGGVQFTNQIPKSPSGKILRVLKTQGKIAAGKNGTRL